MPLESHQMRHKLLREGTERRWLYILSPEVKNHNEVFLSTWFLLILSWFNHSLVKIIKVIKLQ